jgi:hypothetical protein
MLPRRRTRPNPHFVGDTWHLIAHTNAMPDVFPLSRTQKVRLDWRIATYEQSPCSGAATDDAIEGNLAPRRGPWLG